MNTQLDLWLTKATSCLSKDAAAQVRAEIEDHYDSARNAAISEGASAEEAPLKAIAALGDPKTANAQFRHVLLTSAEARMLRDSNWEARTICSRRWLKWTISLLPLMVLIASAVFYFRGEVALARDLLAGGSALALVIAAPYLPIYTRSRAMLFRIVKWTAFMGALMYISPWPWLFAVCLWPIVWTEWTRTSIRRKLPVSQWPKQLYL